MAVRITSKLEDWAALNDTDWPVLFLGNGTSINVWEGFAYPRLFDKAQLGTAATKLFSEMRTTNFEGVLEAVMHAETVLGALGRSTSSVQSLYEEVRDGLFGAVTDVHVPHNRVPEQTLHTIGQTLNEHEAVFTTNYDLLPYWALMETPHVQIADFFWSNGNHSFDPSRSDLFGGWTGIYFLHGGVHLWQDDTTGLTGKWTSSGGGLLRLRAQYQRRPSRRPLFVSEGSARAKRRTIRRSDYLTFALDAFRDESRNVVIIGSALGRPDAHILEALSAGPRRIIAVGLRSGGSGEKIIERKASIMEALRGHTVRFFDSATHPLGDAALTLTFP